MGKKKCWMCDRNQYGVLDKDAPVDRLVDEKKEYYVIVPQDPHVWCHIMVVLKQGHHKGLVEATDKDLEKLIGPVVKWKNILKKALNCDRVYLVCLCDDKPHKRHLHYHLLPVQNEQKTYFGRGLQWLGNLECRDDMMPFDKCSPNEKEARGKYIESMVKFLKE